MTDNSNTNTIRSMIASQSNLPDCSHCLHFDTCALHNVLDNSHCWRFFAKGELHGRLILLASICDYFQENTE